MRSIGKRRTDKLKAIIFEAFDKDVFVSMNEVINRVPIEYWDTWEMADQEIQRIIRDELDNLRSGLKESY